MDPSRCSERKKKDVAMNSSTSPSFGKGQGHIMPGLMMATTDVSVHSQRKKNSVRDHEDNPMALIAQVSCVR